jgi:hypothetical protein
VESTWLVIDERYDYCAQDKDLRKALEKLDAKVVC